MPIKYTSRTTTRNDLKMNAKVAIPYDEGSINGHFGQSAKFKLYSVAGGAIASTEIVEAQAVGHDELGLWLLKQGVNVVVCGNIGPGSQGALAAAGIFVFAGNEGSADEAVARLVAGELAPSRGANCNCGHHGGGCSRSCSGCGSSHCHSR